MADAAITRSVCVALSLSLPHPLTHSLTLRCRIHWSPLCERTKPTLERASRSNETAISLALALAHVCVYTLGQVSLLNATTCFPSQRVESKLPGVSGLLLLINVPAQLVRAGWTFDCTCRLCTMQCKQFFPCKQKVKQGFADQVRT